MDATLEDVLEKLAAYLKAPDILIKIEGKDADQRYIDRLTGELQRREQLWLIFDNLETILKADRKFRDEGMDMLFTSLRGSTHNAKTIVTCRVLPELKNGKELIDAVEKKQMRELDGLSAPTLLSPDSTSYHNPLSYMRLSHFFSANTFCTKSVLTLT